MNMKNKIFNTLFIVFFFLFMGTTFYILNRNVSLRSDDIYYCHKYLSTNKYILPQPINPNQKICCLSDIIDSQINHYQSMNGRFFVHSIVQFFCGIAGKNCFNYFNTIVFLVLLFFICKLCIGENRFTLYKVILIIGLFWILFPYKACYSSCIAFSVNYLWSSAFCVLFIYLLSYKEDIYKNKIIIYTICFITCFLIGSMHEGFCMGISFASMMIIIQERKYIGKYKFILCLGFMLGSLILLCCPANWNNIIGKANSSTSFVEIINSRLIILYKLRRFWFAFAIMVATIVYKHNYYKINIEYNYIPNIILGQLLFLMVLGYKNDRSLFGIEFFSLLLVLKAISNTIMSRYESFLKIPTILMLFILIYGSTRILHYSKIINNEYNYVVNQYKQKGIIKLQNIETNSFWATYTNRFSSYQWEIDAIIFQNKKK